MRTRFHIEKRRDEAGKLLSEDRPVLMSVTFGGNRVILGTGVKVDLNGWDKELQRIQSSYPGFRSGNNWLDTMQETAGKTMEALLISDQDPDPQNFRSMFQILKPKYSSGFFDIFYLFMENKSSSWSSATYRKVRSLYNLLREFEDQSGIPISFHSLDAQFLERFIAFCQGKGYKHSTSYKAVNNLVWFLNWATDKGYNIYREYRQFYKLLDAPVADARSTLPLSLSWNELDRLREFEAANRRMERVRDLFCFMCFTGLRFSELQRLKKEDLKEKDLLVRKPGERTRVIPMNNYALHICQKYGNKYYLNNTAFPSMSIITMNKYLRLIGKELGLKRVIYSDIAGEEGVPLYSKLTAGIAVNTFIRNALELEVPLEIISRFTGVQKDIRVRRIKADLAIEEMNKFNA